MYEHTIVRKSEEYKVLAAMHGINIDKSDHRENNNSSSNETSTMSQQPRGQSLPIFGDSDSYKHLSQDKKESKTKQMMTQHRTWQQKGIV